MSSEEGRHRPAGEQRESLDLFLCRVLNAAERSCLPPFRTTSVTLDCDIGNVPGIYMLDTDCTAVANAAAAISLS